MSAGVPSRNLAGIQALDDLSRESFQKIFRHHFSNKELMVKNLPGLEDLMGTNDYYNSDIRTLNIGIVRDPDDIDDVDEDASDEDLEHLGVIIKTPVGSNFARMIQKIARPFMKEYLW